MVRVCWMGLWRLTDDDLSNVWADRSQTHERTRHRCVWIPFRPDNRLGNSVMTTRMGARHILWEGPALIGAKILLAFSVFFYVSFLVLVEYWVWKGLIFDRFLKANLVCFLSFFYSTAGEFALGLGVFVWFWAHAVCQIEFQCWIICTCRFVILDAVVWEKPSFKQRSFDCCKSK